MDYRRAREESSSAFFFLMIRRPPRSTLFPLHDALPICPSGRDRISRLPAGLDASRPPVHAPLSRGVMGRVAHRTPRSEEHTSELQSRQYLVCRLLLEKKKIYCLLFILLPRIRSSITPAL